MVFFESAKENLAKTRTLFLRIVSISYCMGFISLYTQIRGLYSADGILPVSEHVRSSSWEELSANPHLLWVASKIGLTVDLWMEVLCLLGGIIGLLASLFPALGNKVSFIFLWLAYISMYSVGQTFLWFQWDILLLETGFLAILASPFNAKRYWKPKPRDHICMMLVRWLLFRMMFASGVVKLQSMCPTWWGLTAMPTHYESQCIPTPLAWYAYNVQGEGTILQKLSVVVTYITEIPLTLFFFAPTKTLRKISFAFQLQLMIAIMLTGNYNFFNLLYIGLCVSLMDDSWMRRNKDDLRVMSNSNRSSKVADIIGNAINFVFIGALIYYTFIYFVTFKNGTVDVSVKFTKKEFDWFISDIGTPYGIILGGAALTFSFVISLWKSIVQSEENEELSVKTKLWNSLSTILHGGVALFIFGISLSVFTRGVQQNVPSFASPLTNQPIIRQGANMNHNLQLVSSYGLFRRMTGVGGRPEVIIEGSMSDTGPWKEFEFLYKPGNLTTAPRFCLPHQPRLDWQMWFAALGHYQHNPWIISLAYRILQGTFFNFYDISSMSF